MRHLVGGICIASVPGTHRLGNTGRPQASVFWRQRLAFGKPTTSIRLYGSPNGKEGMEYRSQASVLQRLEQQKRAQPSLARVRQIHLFVWQPPARRRLLMNTITSRWKVKLGGPFLAFDPESDRPSASNDVLCKNCGRTITAFLRQMAVHNSTIFCQQCGEVYGRVEDSAS